MGGIAIFCGIAAAFAVQYVGTMLLGWPVVLVPSPKLRVNYWMLVLAFCVIFGTGLLDDKFSLKPAQKLAGQVFAAVIAVAGGLVIGDISSPLCLLYTSVFPYLKENLDDVMCVEDDELVVSFLDMVENHKMIVENSGLLSVAASKHLPADGKRVACVLSGGNMDVITMSSVVQHGLIQRCLLYTSFPIRSRRRTILLI